MAAALFSSRSNSVPLWEPPATAAPVQAAARANTNKTTMDCLVMALIFAARPFCPPQEEVDTAVRPDVAVGLEVQFGDVPEAQAERQGAPQVVAGGLQSGDGPALHPPVRPAVEVGLEVQFGDVPEAQAERQGAPQVVAGMLQSGDGLALLAFAAFDGNLDAGVLGVGADVNFADIHGQQARVLQLEGDQLGKLLPHGFRYPQCAPFIHGRTRGRGS